MTMSRSDDYSMLPAYRPDRPTRADGTPRSSPICVASARGVGHCCLVARYDEMGEGYARERRADPRIAARIAAALGGARTVVNIGAGSGNYEPVDRQSGRG